jgi:hypothetical protein
MPPRLISSRRNPIRPDSSRCTSATPAVRAAASAAGEEE